jgi:hypothetical protein
VQPDAVPRERQDVAVVGARVEGVRVQGGVEESRMDAEPVDVVAMVGRQRRLGEDLLATPPHAGQPGEGRPVLVSAFREAFVEVLDRLGNGARGWPLAEVEAAARGLVVRVGQQPGGVPGPLAVASGAVHLHSPATGGVRRADGDPQADGRVRREHQRRLDHQLVEHAVAELVADLDREVDVGGAGDEHVVLDPVAGQPRVGRQ